MKKIIFLLSIVLNIIFILGLLYWSWSSPTYDKGRLEENLKIGYFTSDSILFQIPKGITVEDVSPRGLGAIGQFERHRFAIIITTSDPNLVKYDLPKDSLSQWGALLSADNFPKIRK